MNSNTERKVNIVSRESKKVLAFPIWTDVSIEEFIEYYKLVGGQGMMFRSGDLKMRGLSDIDFLEPIKDSIQYLDITLSILKSGQVFFSQLTNLEYLHVRSFNDEPIDLSNFRKLRKYNGLYDPKWITGVEVLDKIQGIDIECKSSKLLEFNDTAVTSMRLEFYKKTDMASLVRFSQLQHLGMVQCKLTNLEGISKFKKLKTLLLAFNRSLRSVSHIVDSTIVKAQVENCRKIEDNEHFGYCSKLIKLHIDNAGSIKDLTPFVESKSLKMLAFGGTKVLNDDLSILENKKWDYLNFSNTRSYNRKTSDFPKYGFEKWNSV